jgi:tetratricopeptide (TPR) repeat protein
MRTIPKKRQLLPHLEAFLSNLDASQKTATLELKKCMEEDCLENVLLLMYDGYNDLGNWQKAREMLERTLTIKEFRYGHDHPFTITTRNNMTLVVFKQGKYEEALQAYQEVFDKSKDLLGPEHPDTLTTRNNMAGVLSDQSKYESLHIQNDCKEINSKNFCQKLENFISQRNVLFFIIINCKIT